MFTRDLPTLPIGNVWLCLSLHGCGEAKSLLTLMTELDFAFAFAFALTTCLLPKSSFTRVSSNDYRLSRVYRSINVHTLQCLRVRHRLGIRATLRLKPLVLGVFISSERASIRTYPCLYECLAQSIGYLGKYVPIYRTGRYNDRPGDGMIPSLPCLLTLRVSGWIDQASLLVHIRAPTCVALGQGIIRFRA